MGEYRRDPKIVFDSPMYSIVPAGFDRRDTVSDSQHDKGGNGGFG